MDELVLGNTGLDFEVVDVLRVVGQELALLVEHGNELVSGCIPVRARQNVFGHRVENGGILAEDTNVENLLRITKTKVLQLGIQTSSLGTEVRNAQGCRDTSTSDENDVAALSDQVDSIVNRVVTQKLGAFRQFTRNSERQ